MQQPCPHCGYISDRPARFCRQCGNALFAENDVTTATTKNYSPHQPPTASPNQPYPSSYGANAGLDDRVRDTSRFYRPPAAYGYDVPAPKKSKAGLWILFSFLALLIIGGGFLTYVLTVVRNHSSAVVAPVAEQVEQEVQQKIAEEVARAQEAAVRAQEEAMRKQEEALRRAAEASSGIPAPPPAPPAPPAPGELPAGIEKYKYPKATVNQSASLVGNEFVHMLTSDSVATVRDYYQKIAGPPAIKGSDVDGEKVIFQIPGSPSTIITVSPDEDSPGKTQIVILRTKYQIPKLN